MIKRIGAFLILGCLLIAIPLAILGYEKVELGGPFLAVMNQTSKDLQNFKIAIPDIPKIPLFESPQGFELVLNFLIKVTNGISGVLNFLIMLINTIIQLLEFIFLMVKNGIAFKNSLHDVSESVGG